MTITVSSFNLEDAEKTVSFLKKQKKEFKVAYEDAAKQFNPKQHKVFDTASRPDKFVQQYRGKDRNGKAIYDTVISPVTRLAIPYQKLIVERLIGTMLGNKIKLTEENLVNDSPEMTDLF